MIMRSLISYLCLLFLLTLFHVEGLYIEAPAGYKMNDHVLFDCYWQCDNDGNTWIDFMECAVDEVAVGTCGVDNRRDCDDKSLCNDIEGYSALKCCKVDVTVTKED